jgi:hypothetical protein
MYNIPNEIVKLWKILFMFFIVVLIISLSIASGLVLTYPKLNLESKVEPAIINGIFTGFAIIFGFVSLEVREIKAAILEKFFLSFPLVFFFMLAIGKYSGDVFEFGYPTYWSLIVVIAGVVFNVFYVFEILYAKERFQMLHDKGIKWERKTSK